MIEFSRPVGRALRRCALAGIVLAALGLGSAPLTAGVHAQQSMQLFGADFFYGGAIPPVHEGNAGGCLGQNQPLTLAWTSVPPTARSLALTMIDSTAPKPGGFVHWIVYDIGPSIGGIDPSSLAAVHQGYNDSGTVGYIGPCPPAGPAHYYTVSLYALNTQLKPQHMTLSQFQQAIKSHVLAVANTVGTFQTS